MSVEILSRIQFTLTVAFHYLYPPMSIGLGCLLVLMEGLYIKARESPLSSPWPTSGPRSSA